MKNMKSMNWFKGVKINFYVSHVITHVKQKERELGKYVMLPC